MDQKFHFAARKLADTHLWEERKVTLPPVARFHLGQAHILPGKPKVN